GCDLSVPARNPFDLALLAQRVGEPVETVADDAVNALDSRREKNLGELIRYPLCHGTFPVSVPNRKPGRPWGTADLRIGVQTFSRCSTPALSPPIRPVSAPSP